MSAGHKPFVSVVGAATRHLYPHAGTHLLELWAEVQRSRVEVAIQKSENRAHDLGWTGGAAEFAHGRSVEIAQPDSDHMAMIEAYCPGVPVIAARACLDGGLYRQVQHPAFAELVGPGIAVRENVGDERADFRGKHLASRGCGIILGIRTQAAQLSPIGQCRVGLRQ